MDIRVAREEFALTCRESGGDFLLPSLDNLTALAAFVCDVPAALVIVADGAEWAVRSSAGLSDHELAEIASNADWLLAHSLLPADDASDLSTHTEFSLVPGGSGPGFYAAAPFITSDNRKIGALCVVDRQRRTLSAAQLRFVRTVAAAIVTQAHLTCLTRGLLDSERHLRAILDHEPECVKVLSPDCELIDINPAGLRMIEASDRQEVIGHSMLALIEPEHRGQFRALCRRVVEGASGTLVFEIVTLRGTRRWVEMHAAPLPDEHAAIHAVLGITRDITAAREADRHIRHLNRMYAVLSHVNQALVREKDLARVIESACRIAVTEGGFRMAWVGLRTNDETTQRIAAHAGADNETLRLVDGDRCECAFTAAALRTGKTSVCNDIASDPDAEPWRADALARNYRAMASLPLIARGQVAGTLNLYSPERGFFDGDELRLLDELAASLGFALEVHDQEAERQRAERALRESEERLRELSENVQEVLWITDPRSQRLLYVSEAYERIWGRSSASLRASPRGWLEAVHADDRPRVELALATKLTEGVYDETYRIQQPDGSIRWIHDRAYPVRDAAGNVLRIVGTAADVTRQRQLEDQLRQSQKMEAVGQLAGGVAHDFNNILTVIHGYGSLLLTSAGLAGDEHDAATEIVDACERAANLTRQLLAFSRRQVMQPRRVDLNDVVTALSRMMRRVLGEDVALRLLLPSHPPVTRADRGLLDQVLMNLMVNAREAMPDGGQLTIETGARRIPASERGTPELNPGDYVFVRVTDSGHGIAPSHLPRIFEPFYTTKAPGKGTGLGLATVFGIVSQHGGSISVTSELGKGTTFDILLPAAGEEAVQTEEAPGTPAPLPGGSETILVVEDEPALRRLTRHLLERAGYVVVEAGDGRDALRVFQDHRDAVRLVVTDIVMPDGMSGRDVAVRLTEQNPGLRVIFTSGYSADIAGRELSLTDRQNFLQKPFSRQQLLQLVRQMLDQTV